MKDAPSFNFRHQHTKRNINELNRLLNDRQRLKAKLILISKFTNCSQIYPKTRCRVLIINNEKFRRENLPTRTGSIVDVKNLRHTVKKFGVKDEDSILCMERNASVKQNTLITSVSINIHNVSLNILFLEIS